MIYLLMFYKGVFFAEIKYRSLFLYLLPTYSPNKSGTRVVISVASQVTSGLNLLYSETT